MGIAVKIIGMEEEINLTDFTIKKYIERMESVNGLDELMAYNAYRIKFYGKVNLYDTAGEVLEMCKLFDWSKKRADDEDAYRYMQVNLLDANGDEYDSLEFRKAFVVTYEENVGMGKGTIEFYTFIRDFREEEEIIWLLAPPEQEDDYEYRDGYIAGDASVKNPIGVAGIPTIDTTDFKGRPMAYVWKNGKKMFNTFYKDGSIYIDEGFGKVTKLSDIAAKDGAEDCISWWWEQGVIHATYNPKMKDEAVRLIREGAKVTITVSMFFCGPDSDRLYCNIDGVIDRDVNMTYAELAYKGIKDRWISKSYHATEYDYFGDDTALDVTFVFKNLSLEESKTKKHITIMIGSEGKMAGQPIAPDNLIWSIEGGLFTRKAGMKADIYLFRQMKPWFGEATPESYYTDKQFSNCAAHEMGHILGLGDNYDGFSQKAAPITDELPRYEIMRGDWDTLVVEENTIEMILEAFKLNKLQIYDPTDRKVSTVIRS